MQQTNSTEHEIDAESDISARSAWEAAIGKVFKLISRNQGVRTVTYTQVKGVKDVQADEFAVEVLCVEIVARGISGKRTHSSICKEGVVHHLADSMLLPESFGAECPWTEFDKVTEAILAYTTSYLDWVAQDTPEESTDIDVGIDLPHLVLTEMEASLVRNSPFLLKDRYVLTPNSIRAALESTQQELTRAARQIRLTDTVDPVYVGRKNAAVSSLQVKLKEAQNSAMVLRKEPGRLGLELDSLSLTLLGQPSTTAVRWLTANPSEEGPVFTVGQRTGPLDFVHWAQVSGRSVPVEKAASLELRSYFRGFNGGYSGPDKDGIYPLLKPATG
jgi:hypothetical protein